MCLLLSLSQLSPPPSSIGGFSPRLQSLGLFFISTYSPVSSWFERGTDRQRLRTSLSGVLPEKTLQIQDIKLAIVGLGYVGLPLAVEFGKKRTVIGFDIKADCIVELQAGYDHTLEVSEGELREAKHLTFTSDLGWLRSR